MPVKRIALGIQYDGSAFSGWQTQSDVPTVQDVLERALGKFTQTRVQTVGDTQLVKTVSWYDNEMSYVSQLVRSLSYFAKMISK